MGLKCTTCIQIYTDKNFAPKRERQSTRQIKPKVMVLCKMQKQLYENILLTIVEFYILSRDCHDNMVVGLTTTCTYRHKYDFKSHSWWGVLLVSFTNITEILLKVELHSLTLLSARLVSFGWSLLCTFHKDYLITCHYKKSLKIPNG